MNIKKSALYLVGGLYFLFFSAACVCNHPGSGVTQTQIPESPKQQQQQAVATDQGTVVDEGTTEVVSGQEGVVEGSTEVVSGQDVIVEEGTTEAVPGDEVIVEEGSTEVVSGDTGVMVDEGTSAPVEGTPADGTPVSE